jgi:F-type H+-transporting ATPase subunit a
MLFDNFNKISEVVKDAVVVEGSHSGGKGDEIMRHIMDSNVYEIFGKEIHLPHIELFGYDISITKHVLMMWIAGIILIFLFRVSFRKGELVPKGIANLLEAIILFVRDEIVYANLGREGKGYVSYFLTLFFFILTCNLMGLVPYASTATGNISVTAALALISFIMIQASGVKKKGLKGYFKEFVPSGIPFWLIPIMIPVEIISMFTKPFALSVRLFANMTGGHVVLLALFSLLSSFMLAPVIFFPLAISLLELLIAFIQAYIFTFLTAIFISLTLHGE